MNAGELVVSLILNVHRFKAQLQDAQREFDTVQAVAHSAGTGISDASDKSAAAISEISASARDAGRDISNAAERGAADIGNIGASARDAGRELERAADRGSDGFERMRGTLSKVVAYCAVPRRRAGPVFSRQVVNSSYWRKSTFRRRIWASKGIRGQ